MIKKINQIQQNFSIKLNDANFQSRDRKNLNSTAQIFLWCFQMQSNYQVIKSDSIGLLWQARQMHGDTLADKCKLQYSRKKQLSHK